MPLLIFEITVFFLFLFVLGFLIFYLPKYLKERARLEEKRKRQAAKKIRQEEARQLKEEEDEKKRIQQAAEEEAARKAEIRRRDEEIKEKKSQQRLLDQKKREEKERQEAEDFRIWKEAQDKKKQEDKERQRIAALEWERDAAEYRRKRAEFDKRLEADIERNKKEYQQRFAKEEEEKKRKKEEETKKREEKEARYKPTGVLYEPIAEDILKKELSGEPPSPFVRCEKALKFNCPKERRLSPVLLSCLLEDVLYCNQHLDIHPRAVALLRLSRTLMQMRIVRTLDNWIGVPVCLGTYLPASHIVKFPEHHDPVFAKNKLYTRIEDPQAILIPAYSDILEFINLHCGITRCTSIELGLEISNLLNGATTQNRCATFLYLCMFGAEAERCPRWFGINVMLLDLVCTGVLTWENLFAPRRGLGFYPPSTVEAVRNSRDPHEYTETIQEEVRIIELWFEQYLGRRLDLSQPEICEILFQRLSRTDLMLGRK
jgi:hypothetical protein